MQPWSRICCILCGVTFSLFYFHLVRNKRYEIFWKNPDFRINHEITDVLPNHPEFYEKLSFIDMEFGHKIGTKISESFVH